MGPVMILLAQERKRERERGVGGGCSPLLVVVALDLPFLTKVVYYLYSSDLGYCTWLLSVSRFVPADFRLLDLVSLKLISVIDSLSLVRQEEEVD